MEFLVGAKAQLKLDVITKVEQGKIPRKQARQILGKSERTLERYIASFRKEGVVFVRHGNQGKKPRNRIDDDLKQKVQALVRNKYFDFNMTHCLEKLREEEKLLIRAETFRKWCHEIHHVKRKKRRRACVRHYRQRMQSTGLLLQMDGSPHKWFGNKDSTLIAAIDDADSDIVYGEFFPAEDTISCMTVLQRIVERKGLFEILYVDRAGIFGGHKRMEFSHVKRALEELGIHIIYAQSPEAKGRVERMFQTLQDRLIPVMRMKNITTYPLANKYLDSEYLPQEWRKKFTVKPKKSLSSYKKLPPNIDLNEIFCMKYYRSVKRDHTVTFEAKLYAIKSPLKHSIYGQQIEFRVYQNLKWRAFYAGQPIELELLETIERKAAA